MPPSRRCGRNHVDPDGVGTLTLKAPSDFATVVATRAESVEELGCPAATATAAPGAVIPLTTVLAPVAVAPGAGELIVSGSTAGAVRDPRYRARVMDGWSRRRRVVRSVSGVGTGPGPRSAARPSRPRW